MISQPFSFALQFFLYIFYVVVVVGSNFKYMLSISVFIFGSFFSSRLAFSTTYLLPPPLLHFSHTFLDLSIFIPIALPEKKS